MNWPLNKIFAVYSKNSVFMNKYRCFYFHQVGVCVSTDSMFRQNPVGQCIVGVGVGGGCKGWVRSLQMGFVWTALAAGNALPGVTVTRERMSNINITTPGKIISKSIETLIASKNSVLCIRQV